MEQDLQQKLAEIEAKLDLTFKAAEKTRKYMLWTIIIAVVVTILPAIGLIFAIPKFIESMSVLSSF